MRSSRGVAIAALILIGTASCVGNDDAQISAGDDEQAPASAGGQPSCRDVETFADALTDTGITYDYQPSESPADLAIAADAVFGGHLTGRTTSEQVSVGDYPHPQSFVGYEVQINRVVKGIELGVDDLVLVFVEYGDTQHRGADYYASAVAPNAPVAIFAFEDERVGELSSSLEGFITSCPDGPLLGWTGGRGDWAGLRAPEQVLDAAGASTTTTTEHSTAAKTGATAGDHICPGNDEVPYTVDMEEAVGERSLVDGACLEDEAVRTSFCADGSERWTP